MSKLEADYILSALKECEDYLKEYAYEDTAEGILDALANIDDMLRGHVFNSEVAKLEDIPEGVMDGCVNHFDE